MKLFWNCRIVLILLVFIIFFNFSYADDSLEIVSPNYFGEQDLVYDEIHYLENEYLSFNFCSEDTIEKIKVFLTCDLEDNKELELFSNTNEEGCFFSNYDLEYAPCDDFSLEVDYFVSNKEKKLKRDFMKQKQSKLINYVLGVDYELLSPIDLSYYLIVLNDIEDSGSKISVEAYDKLKNDRDNYNKCWSSGSCSISDTSQILRNLKLAGYGLDTRLLEDGRSYLEKRLINNDNNPLNFRIDLSDDTLTNESITCSLEIDDEDAKNYLFDADVKYLSKSASNKIIFTCNQTVEGIDFKVYNLNNNTMYSDEFESQSSFSYEIGDFGCVGSSGECDYPSTINSLNAFGTTIDESKNLVTYIDSLVITEPDNTNYLDTSDKYENIGKFLYFQANEGLMDFLKFNQNNDGSWGKDSRYDKIVETAWAVVGLQARDSNAEHTKDGEKWIYFNEPEAGWGTIEKNSMAYLAIKEQIKPYLKVSTLNEIDGEVEIAIENPTIHNLKDIKIVTSKEIQEHVSYLESLGDLGGEEKTKFNISLAENFYGKITGEFKIIGVDGKNNEIELVDFPVNLKGPMPLDLIGGDYFVSQDLPNVFLEIKQNLPTYNVACSYVNPFNNQIINLTLTDEDDSLEVDNSALKSGEFELDLECIYDSNSFVDSALINLTVANKSFDLGTEKIELNSYEDFAVSLTSLVNEKQVLTTRLDGDYENLIESAEDNKIVGPMDQRDLFFTIQNPVFLEALGNHSKGNIIIESSSGYIKEIPLEFKVGVVEKSNSKELLKWYIGGLILFILFIGFIIYRLIEYRKYEEESLPEEYHDGGELVDEINF